MPPAAMIDSWFSPVQAVSSADLCNAFLEHHDLAFPLLQLHLKQDRLYAVQAGSFEDFFVRHVVLPVDAKDGAQAALVKLLQ